MSVMSRNRTALIRSWSRWFGLGITAVMVMFPFTVAIAMVFSRIAGIHVLVGWSQPLDMSALPAGAALLVAFGVAVQLGLYLLPMFFLRRLFGLWARGDILDRSAAQAIRHTGIALLAAVVVTGLLMPLLSLGMGEFGYGPAFDLELGNILAAGVIYVVGLVLDEAARVAEDAELTI